MSDFKTSEVKPVTVENTGTITLIFECTTDKANSFELAPGETHELKVGDYIVKTKGDDSVVIATIHYSDDDKIFKITAQLGKEGAMFESHVNLVPKDNKGN